VRLLNDFYPTLIVVLVVVLLAGLIIYNSNENQKKVIEAVKQAQTQRQLELDRTLDAIRQQMGDDEKWQQVEKNLRQSIKP